MGRRSSGKLGRQPVADARRDRGSGRRRRALWYRDGQAGFGDYTQLRVRAPYRLRAPVPIAVLVGEATASSAEVLAVALRAGPATRLFGTPTRGLSAGNRTFALADGASLVLTVAATSDRAGQLVLGPVIPDEQIGRRGGTGRGGDAAATLRAATDWLARRESCR
jgi:C-terminal processing protease CtpA/Prc